MSYSSYAKENGKIVQHTQIVPTIENVLEDSRDMVSKISYPVEAPEGISAPVLQMPGGLPCPWCGAEMEMISDSYVAVCNSHSTHVVVWVPWGG
jgi:hypothetical protein